MVKLIYTYSTFVGFIESFSNILIKLHQKSFLSNYVYFILLKTYLSEIPDAAIIRFLLLEKIERKKHWFIPSFWYVSVSIKNICSSLKIISWKDVTIVRANQSNTATRNTDRHFFTNQIRRLSISTEIYTAARKMGSDMLIFTPLLLFL